MTNNFESITNIYKEALEKIALDYRIYTSEQGTLHKETLFCDCPKCIAKEALLKVHDLLFG